MGADCAPVPAGKAYSAPHTHIGVLILNLDGVQQSIFGGTTQFKSNQIKNIYCKMTLKQLLITEIHNN